MKTTEILKDLEKGVKNVFNDDNYIKWLNTCAKFYDYSFNNCVLIAMQCPEASFVAGYKKWQKEFKRNVKSGEKAIRIIAPMIKKETKANGEEETVSYFRAVSVFDISQTEGEALPEYHFKRPIGSVEEFDLYKQSLELISTVPVIYDDNLKIQNASGYYSRSDNDIHIDKHLNQKATIDCLIHEIAHSRLHKERNDKDRHTKEVEAQSVAYVVAKHFGISTDDASFDCIAGWSKDKELKELKSSMSIISETSRSIIKELEEQLDKLRAA